MELRLFFETRRGEFRLTVDLILAARVTALFGPSGSGKSTLLECVSGVLRPESGEIRFGDEVLFSAPEPSVWVPPERRRFGYVFQEGLLFPHLSVRRNIEYGRRRYGDAAIPIDAVIEVLEIGALLGRRPHELSVGERQRVALARALAMSPRLLLLDEPLAALDRPLKERILPYLTLVRDEFNVPMLYVTHAIDEVFTLAEEVVQVRKGTARDPIPVEEFRAATTPA